MAKKQDEQKKPTNLVQIACIIALVALAYIDSQAPPDFEISMWVYTIIGGLLLGVTPIKEFLRSLLK